MLLKRLELYKLRPDILQHSLDATTCLVLHAFRPGTDYMPLKADAEAFMHAALTAMRAHSANADVQSAACGLLGQLPLGNPQLAVAAAEAGVIEALTQALSAFTNFHDVGVCNAACLAFGNLAFKSPTSCQHAIAAGAVAACW